MVDGNMYYPVAKQGEQKLQFGPEQGLVFLLLEPDDLAFTFDLKSGYHHIDICSQHQKYLGFHWEGKWYVFAVLSFGLSTACYINT